MNRTRPARAGTQNAAFRAGGAFISVIMPPKHKKHLNIHKFYTVTLEPNISSPITSCSPKFRKG